MKYKPQKENEWIQPVMSGYKMMCCDCGLVHKLDFRISEEGRIQFRAFRDNRATGQKRRYITTLNAEQIRGDATVKIRLVTCPQCKYFYDERTWCDRYNKSIAATDEMLPECRRQQFLKYWRKLCRSNKK